jgi:two-component system, NarL family, invasion response regulator UvrY
MIRILIADDHEIVRKGLKQIVSENMGMVVTGEAATAEEALELARKEEFDVAIIDIAMPGRGGLDILKDLRVARPSLRIIILSVWDEKQYAVRSVQHGASAYITKANATDQLVAAINAVASGRRYITPSVAERLASHVEETERSLPHEALSGRELQVLVLLGSGTSMGDISRDLCLSIKTVSTYRTRILEKMGMSSNAQLIRYAIENNLAK